MKKVVSLLALALMLGALAEPASAQRRDRDFDRPVDPPRGPAMGPDWEELGCVEVSRRPGIDSILIGRREGRYVAIRFVARYRDIYLDGARVIYGNGQPDDLKIRSELRDGDATNTIDLQGRERFIDRIEVATQKAERAFGRGQLCAYGLQVRDRFEDRRDRFEDRRDRFEDRRGDMRPDDRRGPPMPEWVDLGCKSIAFGSDSDYIPVGRREGRFKAIRLLALKNDVGVTQVRVNYANGQPDVLAWGGVLRKNLVSEPLDLKGYERSIQSIQLIMRTKIKSFGSLLKGEAKVCVQGLQ